MQELRLSEYREGFRLWLPKGAQVIAVREQGLAMASCVWTVLEDASPAEKTLRRFVALEPKDVIQRGPEQLKYIGMIGAGVDARAVFEVVGLRKTID